MSQTGTLKAVAERIGAPGGSYQSYNFDPEFGEPVHNSAKVETSELRDDVPAVRFKTMRSTPADPVGMEPKTNLSSRSFAELTGVSKPPIASKAYGLSSIEEANFGHSNLAWYIYTCWAKEKGAVLRPDMFWFTIVNEIAREVRLFPDDYRTLFTSSDEKQTLIVLTSDVTAMPIHSLDAILEEKVTDKVLKACITDVPFVTKTSEGYSEVIKSSFAYMASPFYDYMTFMCGIPEVAVEGKAEDWLAMIQSCNIMSQRFPAGSRLAAYVEHVADLLQDIHDNAFCDLSKEEVRQASESFFSAIFWATSNCGSGSPYYCKGWICELYNRSMTSERHAKASWNNEKKTFSKKDFGKGRHCDMDNITEFAPHVSCVEWQNSETGRMFTQISGLFYSKCDGEYLIPYYGTATYELSKEEFEKLKQPRKEE
eukprot:TRINITY_DN365_c0_g1_i6.p1 TRINITY_DN365_c0_g1~~TRINITY_DN365_c0_g1_i6.p1  ORF type:complete len:426 (+),score=100.77 TRINITY_DN365_c0_g1_i6:47-1324(+)